MQNSSISDELNLLRQEKGPPRPLASGNMLEAGTSTFSNIIIPVIEARNESLPSKLNLII